MEISLTLLAMVLCLLVEGFFSGSEIAVVSADNAKLRHAAAKGSRGAALALDMLRNPEWLLSTTLVGTNIAVVTNTTLATALMIQLFGDQGSAFAIILVAPLIWIFGEIVPKSVFQQQADVITPRIIFVLKFASYLFSPILAVFSSLARLMTKIFGKSEGPFTLREEIITMLQMPAQESDVRASETTMIRRMFDFSETTVQQVMVPLIDVVAVERGATCGDAMRIAAESNHVRLPVYEERVDQIVGMIHTLDMLGLDPDQAIEPFVRQPRFVPGEKASRDLLIELRQDGDAVAVVVDEFGGASGIVSIEDVMEEVVESLEDEYDNAESPAEWIRKVSDREYLINGRVELVMLEERLGLRFPKAKYVTLAGFLLGKAQDIPSVGTVIEVDDASYTVTQASPQAIQEIRVRW